jgi:hypothetical protein
MYIMKHLRKNPINKIHHNQINTMSSTTIENITLFNEPNEWWGYTFTMSDTSKNITCKIENFHKCCEKWGVYTDSVLNDFIGSEYHSIDIEDVNSNREDYDEMVTMKIHINTNKGKITIQFYNEHNGYYTHDVFIQTIQGHKYISL